MISCSAVKKYALKMKTEMSRIIFWYNMFHLYKIYQMLWNFLLQMIKRYYWCNCHGWRCRMFIRSLRKLFVNLFEIIIIYSLRIFHICVNWWSFTGVWVTASLLKSPGLFSVFWPISIILLFGWSPLVLLFQSRQVSLIILWWLY